MQVFRDFWQRFYVFKALQYDSFVSNFLVIHFQDAQEFSKLFMSLLESSLSNQVS